MTKTLTEQWRKGKLPEDTYYVRFICGRYGVYEFEQFKGFGFDNDLAYIKEVLAPVPSYRQLYGPNDGNMPTGVFTVLKIIKENIDITQKQRRLTDLECGIKSQVVSLLKKLGVK